MEVVQGSNWGCSAEGKKNMSIHNVLTALHSSRLVQKINSPFRR
jgi:hypothetical protein